MSAIGRYEIVRQTGNHGLGSLYQAFDPVMQRPVTIRIADGATSQARQAILFDAKQLAHLDHPNIIKFLACEEDDGRPYLVMERFDGKPISGRLSPEVLSKVLRSAALALDHAHSKGLIHRNLTPESLLLDDDGNLKITGFEIARPAQYLNSDQAGEDLDLLLDSIHYMSPELVKGDVLDARADQYSLGVIAWRTLTGSLPFTGESPITLLSKIAFEPPELRGASIAVKKIFERVFSKAPADRFASSAEFAAGFETALRQLDPLPVVVSSRPAPPEERKSLLPWVVAAIVIVVFAVVGAIIMLRPPRNVAPVVKTAPAPEIVPAPPPPMVVKSPAPVKAKPKVAKKAAPEKDTTPETPKLKPLEPKVVHQ
ncbi:MAG TPA: serine/threonine-protein kinase [Bryobacteraceae bacterium]|jgi:serine/threonine protein kinase|nr:serine/threonine-protein kinase [Bryobacteraceae bacterium]